MQLPIRLPQGPCNLIGRTSAHFLFDRFRTVLRIALISFSERLPKLFPDSSLHLQQARPFLSLRPCHTQPIREVKKFDTSTRRESVANESGVMSRLFLDFVSLSVWSFSGGRVLAPEQVLTPFLPKKTSAHFLFDRFALFSESPF